MSSTTPTKAWYDDGRVLAVLGAAGFSLKAIFVKLAYAAYPVDAVTLLALRMGMALPAFLWLARGRWVFSATGRQWGGLIVLGVIGYYASSLFDFIGLRFISAGLERLILFTYPALVVLLEALWRKRPVSRRLLAGMALAYLGILAAFAHDLRHNVGGAAIFVGGAWVFLSSLTYAGYYLGSAVMVREVGAERLAGAASSVAAFLILGHFALTHDLGDLSVLPPAIWGWSAAMASISTILPIWLSSRAVARLGASRTAAIGSLGPALTIVFGWIILGEAFSATQLVGVVLVVMGVWWVGRSKVSVE